MLQVSRCAGLQVEKYTVIGRHTWVDLNLFKLIIMMCAMQVHRSVAYKVLHSSTVQDMVQVAGKQSSK